MRHVLKAIGTLAVCSLGYSAAFAAPPPIDVSWQTTGNLLGMSELDGSPGAELLMGGTSSGRIFIIESAGGTQVYELPVQYGDGTTAITMIDDFDGVGANELFVWHRVPAVASYYGMFWHDGTKFVPRWEATDGMATLPALTTVEINGDGRRHIVTWDVQGVKILDALNGMLLYDSTDLTPNLQPLSVAVVDMNEDGTEELLVTANDTSIPATVQVLIQSTTTVGVEPTIGVVGTMLQQNAPNPFRGPTQIGFTVPRRGHVKVNVYDVSGRLVRGLVDESRIAGTHTIEWDGRDLSGRLAPSGSYFYEIEVDGARESRRMVRLR